MSDFKWDEDAKAIVTQHWKLDRSASQIAGILNSLGRGTVTRSAVCGKIKRLRDENEIGFIAVRGAIGNRRPKQRKVIKAEKKPIPEPTPIKRGTPSLPQIGGLKALPPLTAPADSKEREQGLGLQVTDLTAHTCRWPIGDPRDPDFCFCGHLPKGGKFTGAPGESPYCEFHANIAYDGVWKKRDPNWVPARMTRSLNFAKY